MGKITLLTLPVITRNIPPPEANRSVAPTHFKKLFYSYQTGLTHPHRPTLFYPEQANRLDLKVPKREIFDRSDFPDFYTIKSLREGDFGVKIKKIKNKYLGFIWGREIPYSYAQSNFKERIPFKTC